MGIIKNHDVKERIKTVSDKARIAIPIDIMMMNQEEKDKEELLLTVLSFFPIDFNKSNRYLG